MAKLGDVCTIVSGTTPKTSVSEYWDGNINWITPAELNEDTVVINESKRKITKAGVNSCGLSPFPAGTVILSSRAPIGKTAIAGTEMYCNQGFKNLICSDKIHNKYLFWFLRSKTEMLNSLGRGATFKEISKSIVENIEIPLPDLPTQQRIADTLDKVSEGIEVCRKMLGELDLMVKAKFVEMFGDVVQNSKHLPIRTLPEISENLDSRRIPITGSVREKGIYPYYGASGIVDYVKDYLFDEEILLISEDGANLLARSTPIAFSAAGKVWVNNHAHVLRFRDRATQCYVENFLNMIDISNYVTGTAQPKLNQAKLNAIPIPTPELDAQKQFMEFTRQIEKIKLTIHGLLDKMETEKLALMQGYFGREV